MRISDWSSDVCSSDLDADRRRGEAFHVAEHREHRRRVVQAAQGGGVSRLAEGKEPDAGLCRGRHPGFGLAGPAEPDAPPGDRNGVRYGKGVSVRVDLRGCRYIKTKTHIDPTSP